MIITETKLLAKILKSVSPKLLKVKTSTINKKI